MTCATYLDHHTKHQIERKVPVRFGIYSIQTQLNTSSVHICLLLRG